MLYEFDQKNRLFWGIVLVQVQQFEIGTRYDPELLQLCGKMIKTKKQEYLSVLWKSLKRKNKWFIASLSAVWK